MKNKLKYRFDNLMSKGTGVLIASLAIVTLLMITIVSFIVWITGSGDGTGFFIPVLGWACSARSIRGTMGGDTGSFLFVGAMFVITLGGIFIFSILVGLLTTGISSKLESLQKGHSIVVESGHTVILGWSSQIFTILSELIEANSNQKNGLHRHHEPDGQGGDGRGDSKPHSEYKDHAHRYTKLQRDRPQRPWLTQPSHREVHHHQRERRRKRD